MLTEGQVDIAVGILGKVVGEIWNPMKAAKMELFVELKARYKQLVFIIAESL